MKTSHKETYRVDYVNILKSITTENLMYTASKISLGEELKIENTVDSLSRISKYSPDKNRYSGLYNLNRYEPIS